MYIQHIYLLHHIICEATYVYRHTIMTRQVLDNVWLGDFCDLNLYSKIMINSSVGISFQVVYECQVYDIAAMGQEL